MAVISAASTPDSIALLITLVCNCLLGESHGAFTSQKTLLPQRCLPHQVSVVVDPLLCWGQTNQQGSRCRKTTEELHGRWGTSVLGMVDSDDNKGYLDEDDNDDGENDDIDPDALQDWRDFRRSLSETGLRTQEDMATTTTSSSGGGDAVGRVTTSASEGGSGDGVEQDQQMPLVQNKEAKKRKSVSKRNEKLLMSQSEDLAKEYMEGVWAHEIPAAEVGGLVCRLPLEAEIYRTAKQTQIGAKLQHRLDSGSKEVENSGVTDNVDMGGSPGVSFSPLAAKTVLWYKGATAIIQDGMDKISTMANEKGEVDPNDMDPESFELIQMYIDNQQTWQEVCLVTEQDEDAGTATMVVINRPMSLKCTENHARLILYGQFQKEGVSETKDFLKFLSAFEEECAIYVGGPDMQSSPALLLHGIKDLLGAVEISPGSNIFSGGLDAAVEGVLSGKYKPLDFRFFVGRHNYKRGELDGKIRFGKYQPIACARSLALKQCIGLPKPLWHEVMELCGGELKELSSLELMKRPDIQPDEE